ncbi:unnamed protein product [Paramecium sonneborni]|uniref:Uncharacterized protein n=1 Tax=Paramecium sonneborni TaxID=65129 RepID=A0A8S1RVA9_9CILI|nr:unnamed protein product [Paramecium sonneborni]
MVTKEICLVKRLIQVISVEQETMFGSHFECLPMTVSQRLSIQTVPNYVVKLCSCLLLFLNYSFQLSQLFFSVSCCKISLKESIYLLICCLVNQLEMHRQVLFICCSQFLYEFS